MSLPPVVVALAAALCVVPACTEEDRLERREDRLVGTWEIQRAVFDEDGALFNRNLTDDYAGNRLTFFRDGTLLYEEAGGRLYDGVWYLDALRDLDEDLEFTLDADFFGLRGELAFRWLGTVDRLTRNDFNVDVAEVDGTLRLRWDRV